MPRRAGKEFAFSDHALAIGTGRDWPRKVEFEMPHPTPRNSYRIRLPRTEPHALDQDEAYFILDNGSGEQAIRFHDYAAQYRHKGLYEQLFYDRLKCASPSKVCDLLRKVLQQNLVEMSEMRVLDVGAGNGMVGERLFELGVARIIGVDIVAEARDACERDRPGIYDAYYVADLCNLDAGTAEDLAAWRVDAMTTVAALGFGDIPPAAFAGAFNFIQADGWVAFNIKDTFLEGEDRSGFSRLVKDMLMSDTIRVHHLERYRHRLSIDGKALHYYAVVAKKEADIPTDWIPAYD